MGRPSQSTRPASKRTSPKIERIAVVFPAPLGPRNPSTLPGATESDAPSRAFTSPYVLKRPPSSSIARGGYPFSVGEQNVRVDSTWAFVRLSRPHFLLGGTLMFAVGAASAPRLDPAAYLVGQAMVTTAQVTAHYVNEYADLEADRRVVQRTLFSGGSGVLVEGLLPARVALRTAVVTTIAAIVASGILAFWSPAAGLLGLAALAISWSYSMPPLRLLGSGFGEVAASLVVAGLVPLIGRLAQGEPPNGSLWWAIFILVSVHMAMILTFELPDLDTDDAAGKRVLAVRLGRRATQALIGLFLVTAGTLTSAGVLTGLLPPSTGTAALPALAPAAVTVTAMRRRPSAVMTAAAVATFVFTGAGLLIGLAG